jgi:hypothetical protein
MTRWSAKQIAMDSLTRWQRKNTRDLCDAIKAASWMLVFQPARPATINVRIDALGAHIIPE